MTVTISESTTGSVTTPTVTLPNLPGTPTPAPTVDWEYTNTQQIKVDFENTNPDTGGGDILEYCLEMDNGLGDIFTSVFCSTHKTTYTTTDVVRGRNYRFRFRVRNAAGWSGYSAVTYVTPSSKPETPPQPTFVSGSDTQIVLSLKKAQMTMELPSLNTS